MSNKVNFIKLFSDLFTKGEMLKAENLITNCVPLDLSEDTDILKIRAEATKRMEEIRSWNIKGRPYPGTYAVANFSAFPKFILAKKKILEKYSSGHLLDIGCYSAVFIKEMAKLGFTCAGEDIHRELMEKLHKELFPEVVLSFGSAEKINWADTEFDIITAFDVLEHVIDFNKAVSEIERVCRPGGMIIINLPRMDKKYKDESFEHLRMFSDSDIQKIFGNKLGYTFELCKDELGRNTSFITYING